MHRPRLLVLVGMILFAAIARLIPHPWNFTPLAAMALFGGAHFSKKSHAFLVPFGALILSDAIIGFYLHMPIIYVSFALIILIGFYLKGKKGFVPAATAVLVSSISFFVITNFGVWAFGPLYPKTLAGLFQCFTAAIPYFRNALGGDAFYAALLFGSFSLAEKRFSILKSQPAASY